jgi:hypothetical protein
MKNWIEFCKVKRFLLDGREIPAVSLGTSPFIGAGQFGYKATDYYKKFYLNPQNMEEIIVKSFELGIPAIQAIAYDRIIQAIKNVRDKLQVNLFSSITIGFHDWRKELEESKIIDPQIAFIFPSITDLRDKAKLKEVIDGIKEAGVIPGCATHTPGKTLPFLEDSGLDIKVYLAPVNPAGKFMGPEPAKLVELYEKAKKPVIGKKVLAAGDIEPGEAFPFVSKIKSVKGITVGITSIQEAEETFEQARKFWPIEV